MAQKTNLNISPYYDDFDPNDQFYKVLFKPGFPVQARELSTLQSILQNQLESFGTHMFKDGSMVIPGNIAYDSNYYSIRVFEDHLGTPVSLYIDQLIGLRLRGETSGAIVTIDNYQYPEDNPDVTDLTLYIKYLQSGPDNVDSGLIIQSGSAVDSGSALYHDKNDQRWAVAKGISSITTAVTPLEHVVTVKSLGDNDAPVDGDKEYGVGEIAINSDGTIWIYS